MVISSTMVVTATIGVLRLTIVATPTACTSAVGVMAWATTSVTAGFRYVACMRKFENVLDSSNFINNYTLNVG